MIDIHNPLEDRIESPEKEHQLLSALIKDKNVFVDYFHDIKSDLFADKINQEMFRILLNMQETEKDITPAAVLNSCQNHVNVNIRIDLQDKLDIILSYNANDTISNLIKDLDIIKKNRIVFDEIISGARIKFMNNEPIEEIIKGITESLLSMDSEARDNSTFENHVDKTLDEISNPDKNKDYIKLQWEEWNKNFGGIIQDRYYLVGGESGAGKTAFVTDLITQVSTDYPSEIAILFYSYEMSHKRVITRLISKLVRFTETKLSQRTKRLSKDELKKVSEAVEIIKKFPVEIVYQTLSDRELKLRTRRFALKNKNKHKIILLDHIGLVATNENDMRVKTIKTSGILKSFATDYKASVFVLTQLRKELTDENNPVNKKNFHKPNDSHIMESGALKADADVVCLLWRPEMRTNQIPYNGNPMFDVRGKLFILNYKNRDGQAPTDLVMGCDIKFSHIYNLVDPFSGLPAPTIAEEAETFKSNPIEDVAKALNAFADSQTESPF